MYVSTETQSQIEEKIVNPKNVGHQSSQLFKS